MTAISCNNVSFSALKLLMVLAFNLNSNTVKKTKKNRMQMEHLFMCKRILKGMNGNELFSGMTSCIRGTPQLYVNKHILKFQKNRTKHYGDTGMLRSLSFSLHNRRAVGTIIRIKICDVTVGELKKCEKYESIQ